MNTTEKLARGWIAKEHDISEQEIVFLSTGTPDFTTPGGIKYEIKRLYGDKIILYPSQVRAFRGDPAIQVAIFADGADKPILITPSSTITEAIDCGKSVVSNIRIIITEDRLQIYIPDKLTEALERYLQDKFPAGGRITSVIVREALYEKLKREGYID